MMYPYMTLPDETEIIHSQIIEEDRIQKVLVHFECPTDNGFGSARCSLPEYTAADLTPFYAVNGW
jgi:GTP cyclohydrolase II